MTTVSDRSSQPLRSTARNPTPQGLGDLADPTKFHDPIKIIDVDSHSVLEMLRQMILIRRCEEMIGRLVEEGEVRCPCHLAIGQEACAVGVAQALRLPQDKVFGAHRSHGHFLAVGGTVHQLLAEVLGRATGCSAGMGGSMHLVARERGLIGTVPIVGATVPMAVGAALAAKIDDTSGVCVAFFGDGACEEGVVQEALNFAATHELPTIFVCENNLFASHLHISLRQRSARIARFAEPHGIPCETIDGNDVLEVWRTAQEAVSHARRGGGPSFIELVTYRWRGHVGPREDIDVGVQRSEDLLLWKGRDPIARLSHGLVDAQLVERSVLADMEAEVKDELDRALRKARTDPYPDLDAPAKMLFSSAGLS